MKVFLGDFVGLIIAGLIFIFALIAICDLGARYSCSNYDAMTGKRTKYKTLDACYVETKSGWMRWDEYKARATTNE